MDRIMSQATVKSNIEGLLRLQKILKQKIVIKTGVFIEDGPRNIEVGRKNEFGNGMTNPQRSFLRLPFFLAKADILKTIKASIGAIMKGEDPISALDRIAKKTKAVVLGAFATGGYGEWKPLSQVTINRKGNDTILVDTGKLEKGIKSKVVINGNAAS